MARITNSLLHTIVFTIALGCRSNSFASEPAANKSQAENVAPKPPEPDLAHSRLDEPPTPDNSVLFTFANGGPTVRLPKIQFPPDVLLKHLNQPIVWDRLSMTFWFPDMTPSNWDSPMAKVLQVERGTYVPEKDRFRVRILWMFYAAPEEDNFDFGIHPNFRVDPRPRRVEMNRFCEHIEGSICIYTMDRFDSKIRNLDMVLAKKSLSENPALKEDYLSHPEKAGFVAKPDAPYEAIMSCGGFECDAYVYSKRFHLQYRIYFSNAAVRHADELFMAIDRMIAVWSGK